MSFCSPTAHFFLSLNNIPLYDEAQLVYPLIYGRASWLLPGLAIMNKAAKHSHADFCVDISFQHFWVNTKE